MAKTEVEIRGPLSEAEFSALKKFLSSRGKFIRKGKRLSLMYFRDKIPKHLNEIKNEKVDLRLRITNRNAEFVLKYGIFGRSNSRKEYSFEIKPEQFGEMIEFLRCLDWHICVAYATKMQTYVFNGVEFTLVRIEGYGCNYEAEILSDENRVEEAEMKIRRICSSLGLREYQKDEFERQCNAINNTRKLQYDFNRDSHSIMLKRFRNYFRD